MDLGLKGRRAVVTGGTRGLGRAIATTLVQEGADVLAVARSAPETPASSVQTALMDLSDPGAVERLAEAVKAWRGGLDILVCNVGSGRSMPPGSETAAEWRRILDINLFAAVHAIEALRDMIASGGAIVCISSITGRRALGAPATYSAAKAALDSMVVNLARPMADRGVRIVGVAPGNLIFEGSVWERKRAEDLAGVEAMLGRDVPLKRLGVPDEIAALVAFLASDRAAFITGTVVVADGGQTGLA